MLCCSCPQAGFIIDELYNVSCRIIHITSGDKLIEHIQTLIEHFTTFGSPVMMGGNEDNQSKGIMGVCQASDQTYLLVVVSNEICV